MKSPRSTSSSLRLPPWWPAVVRVLQPTGGLFAAIATIWALRAVAWYVRPITWPVAPPIREVFKALAWDATLALTVVALSRATLAVPHARLAKVAQGLLGIGVAVAVTIRWFDISHCVLARAHWTADAFLYLDRGFSGTAADPRLLTALAGVGATAWLAMATLRWDRAQLHPKISTLDVRSWLIVPVLLCSFPMAWVTRDAIAYRPSVDEARLVPEFNFALQAIDYTSTASNLAQAPQLPPALAHKFHTLGVAHPLAPLHGDWPIVRNSFQFEPFPHPPKANAPAQPNVVITFLESTNAVFVHGLSGHYQGLMPATSALVPRMTSVDGFRNTASPTISALVTALCSLHPPAHPRDLRPGQSVAGKAAYTCLADLLRRRGYRTVFLQGASKTVTSKEYFLRTHGFDEVIGREDLEPLYRDRFKSGPWGVHDEQLADYAEQKIKSLEAQRARDGRPYLLVMLTLDAHEPGMAADNCQLPRTNAGQLAVTDAPDTPTAVDLLRGYHCTDHAVERLGRAILDQPRATHTVWLLTADHAGFSNVLGPPGLYADPAQIGDSVAVPFLLHDPLHHLPAHVATLSGTRDLTPTLLHLLAVPDTANSLSGMSIFGKRPHFPLLVGRVGERLAFTHAPGVHVELPLGALRNDCKQGRVLARFGDTDWTACDLQAWLRWQDQLWQSQRLFPPALYRGADGVERDALAARQDIDPVDATPTTAPVDDDH